MSARRTIPALVLLLLAAGGLTTACARRPATTSVSTPAPTAAVVAPPAGPAPRTLAVAAPTPAPSAPTPAGPAASTTAAVRPPPAAFAENSALADIHFDFDSPAIRPVDARVLDANAAWLHEHPKALVLIEGHCDARGTNEYNLALGARRAQAARAHLVGRGIAAGRISTISYGKERPACSESTQACWARNRRGHFLTKPE